MVVRVADDFSAIAARLREIEAEKLGWAVVQPLEMTAPALVRRRSAWAREIERNAREAEAVRSFDIYDPDGVRWQTVASVQGEKPSPAIGYDFPAGAVVAEARVSPRGVTICGVGVLPDDKVTVEIGHDRRPVVRVMRDGVEVGRGG